LNDIERQKLIQAAVFFLKNTRNVGLVKLFKLLYYLDMLHFRETGRSVTGLDYKALPYGPVPVELYRETQSPPPDLAAAVRFQSPPTGDDVSEQAPKFTKITAASDPGLADLTKRERRILSELVEIFRDVNAEQISDISHARNGPWDLAIKAAEGKWGSPIDYRHSINLKLGSGNPVPAEELLERVADYDEVRRHFG
jgi:uncharacterized phage-associated protein